MMVENFSKQISVAPMMDWTDRHDRAFLRLFSRDIVLYTEMITSHALMHGDRQHLLAYDAIEQPLVLQLGGSEPGDLAHCAAWGEQAGYQAINLNVGCPSPRVSKGRFGACLMLEPSLVAKCVASMQAAVSIPITVKCRIGVDNNDSYAELTNFIQQVASVGCQEFIVHARKAWLQGLSPKQNREIPPLHYDVVLQLKQDFPDLTIIINGGIKTLAQVKQLLPQVDGVMIGREAYHNPYFLAEIANYYFNTPLPSRHAIMAKFIPYIEQQLCLGVRLNSITRHVLGLFQAQRGAGIWRRYLSQNAHLPGAGTQVIYEALALVAENE